MSGYLLVFQQFMFRLNSSLSYQKEYIPGCIFFQQKFDKLSGNVKRQDALSHLLQNPEVAPFGGGEAIHPGHGASKHCSKGHSQQQLDSVWYS